jgi:DNA-binding CsgD family transcriptional regulator
MHEAVLEALLERTMRRPMLALTTDGRVLWASTGVAALLPQVRGEDDRVSGALLDAVADIAGLAVRPSSDVPTHAIALHVNGAPVRAELSVSWMAGDEAFVVVEIDCPEPPALPPGLVLRHGVTAAERSVLELLASGLSNKQIGEQLFISPATVRTHLYHVFRKLGVRTRVQAALLVSSYRS